MPSAHAATSITLRRSAIPCEANHTSARTLAIVAIRRRLSPAEPSRLVRDGHEQLSEPFVVDPRPIRRERIGIGEPNGPMAEHVLAEAYMSPQIRIAGRPGHHERHPEQQERVEQLSEGHDFRSCRLFERLQRRAA